MCTAVDGGSIHRTARRSSAASNQTSTTPITSHRTKDRRKPLRSGVLGCVSGCSGSTPMPDLTGEHGGLSQSSPVPTVCPEAFPIKASASRSFMRSSVARLSFSVHRDRLPRARKEKTVSVPTKEYSKSLQRLSTTNRVNVVDTVRI